MIIYILDICWMVLDSIITEGNKNGMDINKYVVYIPCANALHLIAGQIFITLKNGQNYVHFWIRKYCWQNPSLNLNLNKALTQP